MDDLRVTWGPADWAEAREQAREQEKQFRLQMCDARERLGLPLRLPRSTSFIVSLRLGNGTIVKARDGSPLYLNYPVLLPRIWYMVLDTSTGGVNKLWFRSPDEMPELVTGEHGEGSLLVVYEEEPE